MTPLRVDLHHAPTLAYAMFEAFNAVAPRYGVRLEGIEDDANEHSDFWRQIADEIIASNPPPEVRMTTPPSDLTPAQPPTADTHDNLWLRLDTVARNVAEYPDLAERIVRLVEAARRERDEWQMRALRAEQSAHTRAARLSEADALASRLAHENIALAAKLNMADAARVAAEGERDRLREAVAAFLAKHPATVGSKSDRPDYVAFVPTGDLWTLHEARLAPSLDSRAAEGGET